MLAAALTSIWGTLPGTDTAPEPPCRYRGPIFIGDAVIPWGAETLLLARLREDVRAAQEDDQP